MMVGDIDGNALIANGSHDLTIDAGQLHDHIAAGEPFSYRMLEGGIVQEDLSVPVKIQLNLPERFRGRVVTARLVPHDRSKSQTAELLMGLGLVGIA